MWAIAAKDTLEALKNKNIIHVILVSLLMGGFYRIYPALARSGEPANVLVYSEGPSALVSSREGGRAFEAWTGYRSAAQMKMSVIFVLVMVGLMLVAHLMLEEKKNRTLQVRSACSAMR